ncbi:hypothetical protein ABZ635_21950 [Nocardiopsis sp. NPDC007018]|uniref:hypothetical protein n=1 Tax=Nocardiopsis sp. NPDC007018 TaxID=3155721 RepID=UPI0033FE167A
MGPGPRQGAPAPARRQEPPAPRDRARHRRPDQGRGPSPEDSLHGGAPAPHGHRPRGRGHGRRRGPGATGAARHARPLWKRLHLPYLGALVVLLPGMTVWPYLTELDAARASGLVRPEAVAVSGNTAELAGSEWETVGYMTGFLDGQPAPPEGTEIVDVGFKVTPGDDDAGTRLKDYCRFRALDGDGRSWEPTNEFSLRNLAEDPGRVLGGCTGSDWEAIPAGRTQSLVVTYLVPAEVADDLRFEVTVSTTDDRFTPRPEALLFEPEPLD